MSLLPLAAAAAAALGLSHAPPAAPAVRLDDRSAWRLVVEAPAYRLTLARRTGQVLELVDRRRGARIVTGSSGCLWAAAPAGSRTSIGGCRGRARTAWDARRATLTLRYPAQPVPATATIRFAADAIDVRLRLENRSPWTLERVVLPADLRAAVRSVEAGYAPVYLPGLRLAPAAFERVFDGVRVYPSRWAFTDFLALDAGGGHLAVSTVNPPPARIAPAALGFVRHGPPGPCSGASFCLVHAFQTWIAPGATWTSPTVRLRVGGDVRASVLAHRAANGVDRYPSLAAKAGRALAALAAAPLVKADLRRGPPPFRDWPDALASLPSPALLHPVSFQPGGHDSSFPDFLPPDPAAGTIAELRAAVEAARARGRLVMPYLNASWWNDGAPSLAGIPDAELAVRARDGTPKRESFSGRDGLVVSPWAPAVRDRVARLFGEWRETVPADCLFFDQLGARPWLRDFNPAAPSPLAYADGWLALVAPYADRCVMVEDGWDRLAESAAGFHGSALMLVREHDEPDEHFGEGAWEPFPLALWLLRDKVLLYQHDLSETTMSEDPETLLWNVAFGFQPSVRWEGPADWTALAAALAQALGPRLAGAALLDYRRVGPTVTESRFEGLTVLANWSADGAAEADGRTLPPHGFLVRGDDGRVLAETLPDGGYRVEGVLYRASAGSSSLRLRAVGRKASAIGIGSQNVTAR